MSSIVLLKNKGYIEKTLEEGLRLIGGFGVLKSPFIIKPNICTDVDETGYANTDVKLVEALIKLVLKEDKDLSIKIVESDSGSKFADETFEKFGYRNLEEKLRNSGFDVSLINLSRSNTISVKLDGLYFKNPKLPEILTEHKYFISVAVAKTHRLTFITGAMKNLFGLLPRKDQFFYHPHINEIIVDINRFVRPNLCIIDARVGLEGWAGPITRSVNSLIIGSKPVSVDATMARIMGFNPERIRHLVEAEKYDLGTLYPNILGEDLKSTMIKFKEPYSLSPAALRKIT